MSSDRLQLSLQKRLNACLKKPENIVCAECPSRLPRWASMNLGIFICTNCSGIHRSLGVHISRVRSTQLDKWTETQVEYMERMGNVRANVFWEKNLPPNVKPTKSDLPTVERYIRQKYERKMYCDKETDGPVPLPAGGGGGDGVAAASPQQAQQQQQHEQQQQQQPRLSAAAGLLDLFGDMPAAPAQPPAAVANTSNQNLGANWMDFGSAPTSTTAVPATATNDDDWGDFSAAPAPTSTTPTPTTAAPANGGVDMFAGFDVAQPQPSSSTTAAKVDTTAIPPQNVASKEDIMGLFDAAPPLMQQPRQPQHNMMMNGVMPHQQQHQQQQQQQIPPMGSGMMMNGGAPQMMMQRQQNVMGGGVPQMQQQMGGFMGAGVPQQQYHQQPHMMQGGGYMQQQLQPQQQPLPQMQMQNMYGGMPPPQVPPQMMYNQQPQIPAMPQTQQLNPNAPPPISFDTFGMPSSTTTAQSVPSPKKEDLFPDLKW